MAMMQPKGANGQPRAEASGERSPTAATSSSTSPLSGSAPSSTQPTRVPTSYVCIDVLPDRGTPPPRLPSMSHSSSPILPSPAPSTLASFVHTPSSPNSPHSGLGLNASGPRVLRHIDPTVTFMSRAALQAYSSFKVTRAGSSAGEPPLHTETTDLELLSSSCMPGSQWSSEIECTFLYRTPFVPRFWESLCRSAGEYSVPFISVRCAYTQFTHLDPSAYVVMQEIVRSSAAENDSETYAPEDVLLSIVYQFNNVSTSSPPLTPDSVTFSTGASRPGTAGSHFSSESTVSHSSTHWVAQAAYIQRSPPSA